MDETKHRAGESLDTATAKWITAALKLRISQRGNDGPEAVDVVVEMVRAFAVERATAIVIQRRERTVERELAVDSRERRRLKKVKAIRQGKYINCGIYQRDE